MYRLTMLHPVMAENNPLPFRFFSLSTVLSSLRFFLLFVYSYFLLFGWWSIIPLCMYIVKIVLMILPLPVNPRSVTWWKIAKMNQKNAKHLRNSLMRASVITQTALKTYLHVLPALTLLMILHCACKHIVVNTKKKKQKNTVR